MNVSVYSEKDDYTRSKINKRYCDKKYVDTEGKCKIH